MLRVLLSFGIGRLPLLMAEPKLDAANMYPLLCHLAKRIERADG